MPTSTGSSLQSSGGACGGACDALGLGLGLGFWATATAETAAITAMVAPAAGVQVLKAVEASNITGAAWDPAGFLAAARANILGSWVDRAAATSAVVTGVAAAASFQRG
jgi:hypothetical protein